MSDEQEKIDTNEQVALRREKLAELREQGRAYPNGFERDTLSSEINDSCADLDKEAVAALDKKVIIAGRIMTRRMMGKASFVHIQDMNGRSQVYVKGDLLDDGVYDDFKRPLPDKWAGLSDQEVKYRQRYIDLIVNEQSRKTFIMRSQVVEAIRQFMIQRSFMEVETPMMHVIPGGATAKPFITHHNALDIPLYLRVAPELYLKRLVVGGFEKVFEVNRNFRNEGLSTRHNPEFTMLEFYWAYADFNDLMDLTEDMLRAVVDKVIGDQCFDSQGESYDFSQPFTRMTVLESIIHYNPEMKLSDLSDRESAKKIAESLGVQVKDSYGLGKIQIEIFEETVEEKLIQPTFITAYPVEVSPLSRRNDNDPFTADRFEFFVSGREIANGFSELNDPEDQESRFLEQVAAKDAGDDEAMHFDADYITALEYGMPPTAGEGIGIDRLVMLFSDSPSIKDVLLFPHMRPQG